MSYHEILGQFNPARTAGGFLPGGSDRQDTDSIEDTALMLDGGIWWVRLAIENHDLIHYLIGNVAFPFTIDSDFP